MAQYISYSLLDFTATGDERIRDIDLSSPFSLLQLDNRSNSRANTHLPLFISIRSFRYSRRSILDRQEMVVESDVKERRLLDLITPPPRYILA